MTLPTPLSNETPKETWDHFTAIGIAEGFIEEPDQKRVIAAWQHLLDTGLVWKLQGWFGRQATAMIEQGLIKPAGSDR